MLRPWLFVALVVAAIGVSAALSQRDDVEAVGRGSVWLIDDEGARIPNESDDETEV